MIINLLVVLGALVLGARYGSLALGALTGLGLAICRHILDRFHGRIWAESPDRDNMTSFLFTLAPGESGNDGQTAGADPQAAGGSEGRDVSRA